jgi:mevalonate kinase
MASSTSGFGHAKVILFGEHAVVYGHPAIAAGLSAGVYAYISDGTGVVTAPGWSLDLQIGDDSLPGRAIASLCDSFQVEKSQIDIWLETGIPGRAGLGSSAAMATAIARALAERSHEQTDMAKAIATCESHFHQTPSGIDSAAAREGGVGHYEKTLGWMPITLPAPVELCIGISGEHHNTGEQVAHVRSLTQAIPMTNRLLEIMGDLARAGKVALTTGDLSQLGYLMNFAHGLLAGIGVTTPNLDTLVHLARSAGALGAKLTGAGGGGAVVALAPGKGDEVLRKWRSQGYYGFLTTIGHD